MCKPNSCHACSSLSFAYYSFKSCLLEVLEYILSIFYLMYVVHFLAYAKSLLSNQLVILLTLSFLEISECTMIKSVHKSLDQHYLRPYCVWNLLNLCMHFFCPNWRLISFDIWQFKTDIEQYESKLQQNWLTAKWAGQDSCCWSLSQLGQSMHAHVQNIEKYIIQISCNKYMKTSYMVNVWIWE
jgi:hypothetical protein